MMKLFSARPPADDLAKDALISQQQQALLDKLDAVIILLEAVIVRTDTALVAMPNAVVVLAVAEARKASAAVAASAWMAVKRHVIELVSKWLWRTLLMFGFGQILLHASPIIDACREIIKGIYE